MAACVFVCTPPALGDSFKAMHLLFRVRLSLPVCEELCARSPVFLLDLDLQQEEVVWGFFSSGEMRERETAGDLQSDIGEPLRAERRALKKERLFKEEKKVHFGVARILKLFNSSFLAID